MRRPPPVARGNDEAFARQFGFECNVIKVATDSELSIAISADEPLHQRRRIAPSLKRGRRDFGEADGADAAGAEWFEQARAAQVRRDHFGDLPAQRFGRSRFGRDHLRCGHDGDSDDDICRGPAHDIHFDGTARRWWRRRRLCDGDSGHRNQKNQQRPNDFQALVLILSRAIYSSN